MEIHSENFPMFSRLDVISKEVIHENLNRGCYIKQKALKLISRPFYINIC